MLKANIKMAFNCLTTAKERNFLALLGVIIGVASVIAMVSIGYIVEREAINQFKALGADFIVGDIDTHNTTFTAIDIESLVPTVSQLTSIAPYISSMDKALFSGKEIPIHFLGVTKNFLGVNQLTLTKGRFLTSFDGYQNFCVIGAEVVARLRELGVPEPLGMMLRVQNNLYKIIGTLESIPKDGLRPYEINKGILINLPLALRVLPGIKLQNFVGRLVDPKAAPLVEIAINAHWHKRFRMPVGVKILSAEEIIKQMEKQLQLFTLLLGAIASISLIVGGVGVMNVMLMSVTSRKQEIGLRRALGARERDIQMQFVIEALILALSGGLLGVLLGVSAAYLMAYLANWEFALSVGALLLGVLVSTAVGLFFGYYPARQAAKLDPINALRTL